MSVKIKQKSKIRGHSQKIDSAHFLSRERLMYYLQENGTSLFETMFKIIVFDVI